MANEPNVKKDREIYIYFPKKLLLNEVIPYQYKMIYPAYLLSTEWEREHLPEIFGMDMSEITDKACELFDEFGLYKKVSREVIEVDRELTFDERLSLLDKFTWICFVSLWIKNREDFYKLFYNRDPGLLSSVRNLTQYGYLERVQCFDPFHNYSACICRDIDPEG